MVNFRSDIQGLRALAILLVVGFHVGVPGMAGGFIGVDVFFTISGYLITSLLVSELQRTGRINLFNFYARRARRLLPASILITIVTLGAAFLFYSPKEIINVANTAIYSNLFSSNIWFIKKSSDYFAADAKLNPLLHTWSLGVEEQFYFLWPVAIYFSLFMVRSLRNLALVLVVITVASFVFCLNWTDSHKSLAFYGSPARAWEFGLGGLASLLPESRRSWVAWLLPLLGWIGLAAVLASTSYLTVLRPFPGAAALAPVAGTVVLLLAGPVPCKWGASRILSTAPMWGIGQLSYSWYLWHWPVLVFALVQNPELSLSGHILWAMLALVIAAVTYFFVEAPIRASSALKLRPLLSLGLALVLIAGAAALSLGGRKAAIIADKAPELAGIREAMSRTTDLDPGCIFPADRVNPCVYGRKDSPTTIVLFGDSHAWQWFAPIEEIANQQGWRLMTFMKTSCPAVQVPADSECSRWREEAMAQILKLQPAGLITSHSADYGMGNLGERVWQAGTRETLATLSSQKIPTLIILETPQLYKYDVPNCLMRAIYHNQQRTSACGMNRTDVYSLQLHSAERNAADGLSLVTLLDLTAYFCDENFCPAIKNNMVVYLDRNHISLDYAKSLSPVLLPHLVALVASEQLR